MRIHMGVGMALILAAMALPLTGAAQRFQEPTKEELQMTSDPKAPGAPAVFLYREEVTDNGNHFVSYYARIKVLTEAGKEWATIEVPYLSEYESKPIVKGRTIHPDGTVYPLTNPIENLGLGQQGDVNRNKIVFSLPNVTIGSILEYSWTRGMAGSVPYTDTGLGKAAKEEDRDSHLGGQTANETPEWEVQQKIFIHKEHFYFNPVTKLEQALKPYSVGESNVLGLVNTSTVHYADGERASNLIFTQRLPEKAQVSKSLKDDFTLDVQDVPAFQDETNSPSENRFPYSVRFFYSPYTSGADYWNNEAKRWSKQVDERAEQTRTIRDAASQIVAGADTTEAKARKLYDAVQALDNTDFTGAKREAEHKRLHLMKEVTKAQDVWKEKCGSSNDLAVLYLALARAAGLNADGLQVADRSKHIFDPDLLSLHQLDTLLVVLHIDGKDIYLDPGDKLCRFGRLFGNYSKTGGLQQNVKGPVYTP